MKVLRALGAALLLTTAGLIAQPVHSVSAAPALPSPMRITIKRAGLNGQKIRLPLDNSLAATEFTVDWDVGNGTPTCPPATFVILPNNPIPEVSCTYGAGDAVGGVTKTISIRPANGATIRTFGTSGAGPVTGATFFTGVTQWGDLGLQSLASAFDGMTNLVSVPATLPSTVTDLTATFYGASNFNDPNVAGWNTANVTKLQGTFANASSFNQNIAAWNTSNVTDMSIMFSQATSFNQNLSNWNTANVTTMWLMFFGAIAFNQSVNDWNVSNLTNASWMFRLATAFNNGAAAGACNVQFHWADSANLTNTSGMFAFASSFNATVVMDTSQVTRMDEMFFAASAYSNGCFGPQLPLQNRPLQLETSNVTNFSEMFRGADAFNQDISTWNVRKGTNMDDMFRDALIFDKDLSSWCFDGAVTRADFATNAGFANTPAKHPSWTTCPIPAPPAPNTASFVPLWTSTLDPAGGTCGSTTSDHSAPWTESFIGYRYLPAADDCRRTGYEFMGWARSSSPSEVVNLPLLVDPSDGMSRYFVANNVDYVAVWREFAGPSTLIVLANVWCIRCTSVWLMWRAPIDRDVIEVVVDGQGTAVCTQSTTTLADWRVCSQSGLSPGSTHTYSLHFTRGIAVSPARSSTVTLRNG